jgi:transcriptional regulator with XRE-family HTH domain
MENNPNFSRTITLLRKEKGISQKAAADALGVSQALLSHYEKGIRECGLTFLTRAADFYGVSCDYLLGRSKEVTGRTISISEIPDGDSPKKERVSPNEMMLAFNKKLILNAANIVFTLIGKTGSAGFMKDASVYMCLSLYKLFRLVHISNLKNDPNFFEIKESAAFALSTAAMNAAEANMMCEATGVSFAGRDTCMDNADETVITSTSLGDAFPATAPAMLNVIKNSEAKMMMLANSEK